MVLERGNRTSTSSYFPNKKTRWEGYRIIAKLTRSNSADPTAAQLTYSTAAATAAATTSPSKLITILRRGSEGVVLTAVHGDLISKEVRKKNRIVSGLASVSGGSTMKTSSKASSRKTTTWDRESSRLVIWIGSILTGSLQSVAVTVEDDTQPCRTRWATQTFSAGPTMPRCANRSTHKSRFTRGGGSRKQRDRVPLATRRAQVVNKWKESGGRIRSSTLLELDRTSCNAADAERYRRCGGAKDGQWQHVRLSNKRLWVRIPPTAEILFLSCARSPGLLSAFGKMSTGFRSSGSST